MASDFVFYCAVSQWQSALPTGGSQWLSALPTGQCPPARRLSKWGIWYIMGMYTQDFGGIRNMKKICLLAAVCLCALLLLSGCSKDEQTQTNPNVTETPVPTQAPTNTPVPTATPKPVEVIPVKEYRYDAVNNVNLQVTFQYPSHWVNDPGKSTICYLEPVNAGEVASRIAVSAKTVSRAPDTTSLKKQLTKFTDLLAESYFSFTPGEQINTDEAVFNTSGISQSYTARDEAGNRITGYILMAYVSSNKHIYVFHFSASSGRYEEMYPVVATVRQSLAVVK